MDDDALLAIIMDNFDFSVSSIIRELDLKRSIYRSTTNYGHFGKAELPWEQFKAIRF